MIAAVETLGETVGIAEACRVLSVPRSSVYRARRAPRSSSAPRPRPEQALSAAEQAQIRQVLNSERFCDCTPRTVYATLLDEGVYYCHWRTMYRILAAHAEVQERRPQRRHPRRAQPNLCARAPNQVWSWDITYLPGPDCFYYLYTIIDIYSRYVPGWMIAIREAGKLAEKLIADTCAKQAVPAQQLTLHSDRGSAMRSKVVHELLQKLGVAQSYSRPGTPTDNPYSEAQFKTLKYGPTYPGHFASLAAAQEWAHAFFYCYNEEHYHTGLALLTPATVHHGQAEQVQAQRQQVLDAAYAAHPERFARGRPTPAALPKEVWINQPQSKQETITMAAESVPSEPQAATQPEPAQDANEPLDIMKQTPFSADEMNMLHLKFELELCQSP